MTSDPYLVESATPYQGSSQAVVGNGNALSISSIGKLTFHTPHKHLPLNGILIMAHFTTNLSSVSRFVKDNSCSIEFNPFSYVGKDFSTRIPLLISNIHNNLYPLKITPSFENHAGFSTCHVSSNLLHQRLGHPCQSIISHLPFSSNVIKPYHSF